MKKKILIAAILAVSATSFANTTNKAEENYTIKKGDTLGDIGYERHTTAPKLGEKNKIENLDLIYAGDDLIVPVVGAEGANEDSPEVAADPEEAQTIVGAGVAGVAVVSAEPEVTTGPVVATTSETKEEDRGTFFLAKDFTELSTTPGFTFGAPSGLVGAWGTGFIAGAGTSNTSGHGSTDAGAAVGVGFGNPVKSIGGTAYLSIGSINPVDGGAGNRGSLGLSVGKTLPKYGLGMSLGVSNTDLWHAHGDDRMDPSFYTAVTKLLPNNVAPVILTAGIGNNAYADASHNDEWTKSEKTKKVGVFFAGAVYVLPQLSLVADYTGGQTTIGASYVPMPKYPLTLGVAAQDLFDADDYYEKVNVLGTISYGFRF